MMSPQTTPPQGLVTPEKTMRPITLITDNDVLCGRGGSINCHPGNEQFRQLVQRKKRIYLTARFKREKRLIASSIVDEIHALNPPGRFLSRIEKPGRRRKKGGEDLGWYEVDDDKARDKTSQALRENAPDVRKEMEVERKQYVMTQAQHVDQQYGNEEEDDYEDKIVPQDDEDMEIDEDKSEKRDDTGKHNGNNGWVPQMPDIHLSSSWSSFKTLASSTAAALLPNGEQSQGGVQVQPQGQPAPSSPVRSSGAMANQHSPYNQNSHTNPNRVVHFEDDGRGYRQASTPEKRMEQVMKPWENHVRDNRSRMQEKNEYAFNSPSNAYHSYNREPEANTPRLVDERKRKSPADVMNSPEASRNRYAHDGHSQFSPGAMQHGSNNIHPEMATSAMTYTQPLSGHQQQPLHSPINTSSHRTHHQQLSQTGFGGHSTQYGFGPNNNRVQPPDRNAHDPSANHRDQSDPSTSFQQQSLQVQDQWAPANIDMQDVEPIPLDQIDKHQPAANTLVEGNVESRLDADAARAGCDAWIHPDWAPFLFCGSISRTDSIDTHDFSFCGNLETCSIDSPIGGSSLCNVFLDNEPHNKTPHVQEGYPPSGSAQQQQQQQHRGSMASWASLGRQDEQQSISDKSLLTPIPLKSEKSDRGVAFHGMEEPVLPTPAVEPPQMQVTMDEPMSGLVHSWDGKKVNE